VQNILLGSNAMGYRRFFKSKAFLEQPAVKALQEVNRLIIVFLKTLNHKRNI